MTRKTVFKTILPVAALVIGAFVFVGLVRSRKAPPRMERPALGPLVRTRGVEVRDVHVIVAANGTVRPETEVELAAEVGGRIVEVGSSMVGGGFFDQGELLVRIDPRDYELAVSKAEAEVARSTFELAREDEESAIALREWEILNPRGAATREKVPSAESLIFRGPQLKLARANLDAAKARLEEAQLARSRTRVVAPFEGRVRNESVGRGQYVTPGRSLGTIYGTAAVEVVFPVPDSDLAWFDVPRTPRGNGRGALVTVVARFSGTEHRWQARVVRSEGTIDSSSRLVNVVARVKHPFVPSVHAGSTVPLAVGMFVEGLIEGRVLEASAVIPRSALRDGNRVWVARDDGTLEMRDVQVSRLTERDVYIHAGLQSDERVILSRIDAVTDGMKVRVADDLSVGGKPDRDDATAAETGGGSAKNPAKGS